MSYSNKTKKGYSFPVADPFVFRWLGKYYMFCTGDFVPVYVSENLTDWSYLGPCIKPDTSNPDILGCYAPEVCYTGGQFYMCFSPKGNKHRIYVSDNLTSGYVPLNVQNFDGIDGSFFLDGKNVIFTRSASVDGTQKDGIYGKKAKDVKSVATSSGWHRINAAYLNGWTEGPFIDERNGYQYLTFTGNHFLSRGYRLAYCYKKSNEELIDFKKGRTFLISTTKDFYGLGHSSTVIAPNLDGRILAFHDLKLDENEKYKTRFANFVNLTYDGENLFANGTGFYPCPNFEKCVSYDENECGDKREFLLPLSKNGYFTAELSVKTYFPFTIFLENNKLDIFNGKISLNDVLQGFFTKMKNENPLIIRIENGKNCKISINGQKAIFTERIKADKIILSSLVTPLYVALSPYAEGSSDKTLIKNAPSRFPAISCSENVKSFVTDEKNYICGKATYKLNVSENGAYAVILNTLAKRSANVSLNGKAITHNFNNGRKVAGVINLEQGLQTLEIISDAYFCDVDLQLKEPENYDFKPVLLHKKLDDKDYNFILTDNDLYDYEVEIKSLNSNLYTGIALRANDYSYFNNQQKESFTGYMLCLFNDFITLNKIDYGKTELAKYELKGNYDTIKIKLINDEITVFVNEKLVISVFDGEFLHGKTGVLSANNFDCDKIKINKIN